MSSPTKVYAGVGFVAGSVAGVLFAGSLDVFNLLVGGFFGLFIGILLALSKYKIWDRK